MPPISVSQRELDKIKSSPRPKSARIEQAANGGYVVTHDSDEYPQPKHAFKNHNEMIRHIKQHFGMMEDKDKDKM